MDFAVYIKQFGALIFFIILSVMILSTVIKWPIKAFALRLVEKKKIGNAKIVTRWLVLLPTALSYMLWFFVCLIIYKSVLQIDYVSWAATSSMIAAASISLYETIDNFVKSKETE